MAIIMIGDFYIYRIPDDRNYQLSMDCWAPNMLVEEDIAHHWAPKSCWKWGHGMKMLCWELNYEYGQCMNNHRYSSLIYKNGTYKVTTLGCITGPHQLCWIDSWEMRTALMHKMKSGGWPHVYNAHPVFLPLACSWCNWRIAAKILCYKSDFRI